MKNKLRIYKKDRLWVLGYNHLRGSTYARNNYGRSPSMIAISPDRDTILQKLRYVISMPGRYGRIPAPSIHEWLD